MAQRKMGETKMFADELPEKCQASNYKTSSIIPPHLKYMVGLATAHVAGFYYLFYLIPFGHVSAWSLVPIISFAHLSGLGTTIGAHRYWTHKTFKANLPLQIILMIVQTTGFQSTIYKWCKDHRVHHKYTDTNSDPHNSKRGFWFSHIGWIMLPRHPDVHKARKIIECSDLDNDPVVQFQKRNYEWLIIIFFLLMPMLGLKLLYPEWSLFTNFSANMARHIIALHFTFLVNSAAHMWGSKPYDKYISSVENRLVSLVAVGEGYHNYHHTFPWDYRASESGLKINLSTLIINFFAYIGWAWDLKTVNQKMLVDRINRTGDYGKHPLFDKNNKDQSEGKTEKDFSQSLSWGWDDADIPKEDLKITEILFEKSRQL